MAYENGYKDGWSSADHATQSYSPYAEESERRERVMSEYQAGLDKEQSYRDKLQSEQAREDWKMSQIEREGREHIAQRREAVNIIVQQKKAAYDSKSWLGKAVAKLRGKSFDKMKRQITEAAEIRVDKMTPEQIEYFIECSAEREGRQR